MPPDPRTQAESDAAAGAAAPAAQAAHSAWLLDAVAAVGRERSADAVLRRVLRLAAELLHAPVGLARWQRTEGGDVVTAHIGLGDDAAARPLQGALADELAARAPVRTILDGSQEPLLAALSSQKVALLGLPLPPPGAGNLVLARPLEQGQFSDSDEVALAALAAQAATSLSALMFDAERRRLEDELRTAERLKTEFVAMTSHELRTPLTSIRAATSMIRSYWDTIEDGRKLRLLEVIEGQSQRLSRLVENILAAANIEAGVVLPRITTVDIATTAEEVARDFAAETDVQVDCERPLLAVADPDHTRQILVNFVGNSLKYGDPPISIIGRRRGPDVELRVTDTGPGVPVDFIPRLFEKFTQASSGDTRHASGSGLGLSIVKGLAEASDGTVRYEPNEPRGACFVVTLPAEDAPT